MTSSFIFTEVQLPHDQSPRTENLHRHFESSKFSAPFDYEYHIFPVDICSQWQFNLVKHCDYFIITFKEEFYLKAPSCHNASLNQSMTTIYRIHP